MSDTASLLREAIQDGDLLAGGMSLLEADVLLILDRLDQITAERDAARAEAARLRENNAGLIGRNVQALTALRRACDDGWTDGDGACAAYLLDAAVNPDPQMPEHGDYTPVTPPTDADRALVDRLARHSPTFTEVTPPTDQGETGR